MQTVLTERLIVRRPLESDLDDFLAYRNHPENLKYQPMPPMEERFAAEFLASMATIKIGTGGAWLMFAVELQGTGRMIGEVGVYLSPFPQSTGDLGWSFHPDYQGRGYATEAAQVLLNYVFQKRALDHVTAKCDARNVASFRLMERLGMRQESPTQENLCTADAPPDTLLYVLTRDEWLARQTPLG